MVCVCVCDCEVTVKPRKVAKEVESLRKRKVLMDSVCGAEREREKKEEVYILGETRLVLCGRKWTVDKGTVLSHCVTDWTFLANNWKKENAGFHPSFSISFFFSIKIC